jgi:hypothetical protein
MTAVFSADQQQCDDLKARLESAINLNPAVEG